MTPQEAVSAVRGAGLVECEAGEYPEIRKALHKYAGDQIDAGQDIYAQIALWEISRLDKIRDNPK